MKDVKIKPLIYMFFFAYILVSCIVSKVEASEYQDEFILSVKGCLKAHTKPSEAIVPTDLVIAQAIIESNWGRSRFATEGNALFGIRTFDLSVPHMKPKDNPDVKWGVKKYETKCDSVNDYIFLLSNSHHYKEFRELLKNGGDYIELANSLKPYSENQEYSKLLIKVIRFVMMRNT